MFPGSSIHCREFPKTHRLREPGVAVGGRESAIGLLWFRWLWTALDLAVVRPGWKKARPPCDLEIGWKRTSCSVVFGGVDTSFTLVAEPPALTKAGGIQETTFSD